MNIVVFDDDYGFLCNIKQTIEKILTNSNITLINGDIDNLKNYISLLEQPTIFFVDIIIKNEPLGFKICDFIYKSNVKALIVFITDYPTKIMMNTIYKIKAFNVILKKSPNFSQELDLTLSSALSLLKKDNLFIYKDKFTTIAITYDGIFYIESIKGKGKVRIYHEKGVFEIRNSLSKLLQTLPANFTRCHNAFIVNVEKIVTINHKTYEITLSNNQTCNYSYLKRNSLGALLK